MNKNKPDQKTDKTENFKPVVIAIFAISAVLVIVLIFILIGRSDEADVLVDQTGDQSTTEVDSEQSSEQGSSDEESISEPVGEPVAEPVAPTEPESPTTGLPDDWDRLNRQARLDFWNGLDDERRDELWENLSPQAKTSLNPFNCPADENNVVHLSAETGECLVSDTDTELPVVPDNALIVGLGVAFITAKTLRLLLPACHALIWSFSLCRLIRI